MPTGRARRACAVLVWVMIGVMGVMPALGGATMAASRTTGDRLTLAPGCAVEGFAMTLTANTPFYVSHGFTWIPGADSAATQAGIMRPTTHFELFVDGARVPSVPYIYYDQSKGYGGKSNLTDYPNGLPSGTYTFEGRWYKDGSLVGGTFGVPVLALDCTMMVTFVP